MDVLDLLALQLEPSASASVGRMRAHAEMARVAASGMRLVSRLDPEYPERLRQIHAPPLVLYVLGELAPSTVGPLVAIVGARAASARGRSLAHALARDLARAGIGVVSGLARGIDTAAHEGALAGGGRSVAVQGRGLDGVYPPENAPLARRLVETGGAVLSEFALGVGPRPEHFPKRNRILAGLADLVVVVEAAEKSGALVTARLALEAGRDVMAVPGHPMDPWAAGTNALLKDGAGLVRDAADILRELGREPSSEAAPLAPADPLLAAIPRDEPLSLEQLAERCPVPVRELLARLTQLEVGGQVRRLPGALFLRAESSGVR